jgi:hypothetical protein
MMNMIHKPNFLISILEMSEEILLVVLNSLIVKYLEYDRRKRKSTKLISSEYETRGLD